jgi:CheY-like chemotaxis protein
LAANGLEVLQALKRQRYDIILMDVRMPEMNGLDATRIIRQRWPGPKPIIIAVTAYGLEGDREKCLDAGMDDHISKPLKLQDLQNILGKYTMISDKESSR